MKKIRWIVFLLTVCTVALICLPVTGGAFAEETVLVTYMYDGQSRGDVSVQKGAELTAPPSYSMLHNLGISAVGKTVSLKLGSEEGEDVVYPYVFNENTTLYIVLTDAEEKVTFSYIYNYIDAETYQVKSVPYSIGAPVNHTVFIGQTSVKDFYSDPALTQTVTQDLFATENRTYYVRPDKTVSFSLNGVNYTAAYGDSLRDVTGTGTHEVLAFYLDEGKTVPYATGIAFDNLTVYGDFVRTHYAVTFVNNDKKKTVYVPLEADGTGIVDESYFPTESDIAAPEWRLEAMTAPEYPFIITDDTTLYASNGMVYPLTKTDRAILHPVGFALLLMAIWGGVYEHRKKKKQKAQQNAQNDVPSDEKDDQKPSDEKDTPVEEQTDSVSNKDNE